MNTFPYIPQDGRNGYCRLMTQEYIVIIGDRTVNNFDVKSPGRSEILKIMIKGKYVRLDTQASPKSTSNGS